MSGSPGESPPRYGDGRLSCLVRLPLGRSARHGADAGRARPHRENMARHTLEPSRDER